MARHHFAQPTGSLFQAQQLQAQAQQLQTQKIQTQKIQLQDSAIALCRGFLAALAVSSLLSTPALMPPVSAQPSPADTQTDSEASAPLPTVGVVQNRDNIAHWPTIMARLNYASVPYQVIDWSTVGRRTDLSHLPVLLLPNVERVSSGQAAALQAFVAQGGHLIVSGEFGAESTPAVQQQLRSLVGAYWAFSMPQSTALHSSTLRLTPDALEQPAMPGGVIVPTGLRSQTLATWEEAVEVRMPNRPGTTEVTTQGAPAVVATQQTTFLGWNWGQGDASTEFDSTWMTLALDHHSTQTSAGSGTESSVQVPTANTLLAPHLPQLTSSPNSRPSNTATNNGGAETTPQNPPHPIATPPASSTVSTPPPSTQARTGPANDARPNRHQRPAIDPTEQVAPAGITVGTGNRPIAPLEAIAMRQELENLMGRFESALLSANAFNSPSNLSLDPVQPSLSSSSLQSRNQPQPPDHENDPVQPDTPVTGDKSILVADQPDHDHLNHVASETDSALLVSASSAGPSNAEAVLTQANRLLDGFSRALDNRNYAIARNRWRQARQLLWDNFPSDRPINQTEIRAMWFDRGTIVAAGSRQRLAEIFDRLAAAGINTIFFETVNAGYPIYPSDVAPQQNPLIPSSWDPLADAVELAHERGMELHAWVWAFATGNQRHNALVNLPHQNLGPVLSAHPNWANYDNYGRAIPVGQNKPFLDPAHPQVRRYLQRLFTEIVTEYDVDGLQLDYIRYPFQDPSGGRYYGYGQAARRQFRRQTGVDPLSISPRDRTLWQEWTDFRTQQIDTFVSEISTHLRRQRPELILSAAVFPMSQHERIQKLQQNWEAWAQHGDIDLIVTMSYAMDTNRLQQLTTPWLTGIAADVSPALVLPGIRLLNLSDSAAIDQIQALRDMPSGGYALFAVENLNNNDNLQTILNRTQGHRPPTALSIPYRQPFEAAVERFEALNREWNFALSTDELWIRDAELTDWYGQTNALQSSLQALANNPSRRRLGRTQRELNQFQEQFGSWMSLYALEDEYRVQTWSNHLSVVQQLLDYGEHQLAID